MHVHRHTCICVLMCLSIKQHRKSHVNEVQALIFLCWDEHQAYMHMSRFVTRWHFEISAIPMCEAIAKGLALLILT